jgi:hypothetical protein
MKQLSCPCESDVSRAARTGRLNSSLAEHVKHCRHCREVARISELLGSAALSDANEVSVPDAAQIWLNAGILAARSARRRALRPVIVAEVISRITIALVISAGIIWLWFGLQSLAAHWNIPHLWLLRPLVVAAIALAASLMALMYARLIQPMLIDE